MPENISTGKKLLIVSDTALYKGVDGFYAFGPVVLEVEYFLKIFDQVSWIGFERIEEKGNPIFKKVPENVKITLLPKSGGNSFLRKFGVILKTPKMVFKIFYNFQGHDIIHTRAPSSPAFLATLLSFFFKRKIFWHKYAGNWGAKDPSFFYGVQILLLKFVTFSKVTINGSWPNQPNHCLSFENPCLNEQEIEEGFQIYSQRSYKAPFTLCFAGRLETPKGVGIILESLKMLDTSIVKEMHFAGDGPEREKFEKIAEQINISIFFHGNLSRSNLFELYKKADFLLLPTIAAEGFPKVLAEAANFGCIPITSATSSIDQYIQNGENGYILSDIHPIALSGQIKGLLRDSTDLKMVGHKAWQIGKLFTYSRYVDRIKNEIL